MKNSRSRSGTRASSRDSIEAAAAGGLAYWLTGFGRRLRVLVVGVRDVGKTAVIQRLIGLERPNNTDSELSGAEAAGITLIRDVSKQVVSVVLDGEESTLEFIEQPSNQVWQPTLDGLIHPDAFVVVYCVVDRDSYDFACDFLYDLTTMDIAKDSPVILVANKTDIVRHRCVAEDEGKAAAMRFHCKYIEVSAVFNHKVDELLVGILKQMRLKLLVKIFKKIKMENQRLRSLEMLSNYSRWKPKWKDKNRKWMFNSAF